MKVNYLLRMMSSLNLQIVGIVVISMPGYLFPCVFGLEYVPFFGEVVFFFSEPREISVQTSDEPSGVALFLPSSQGNLSTAFVGALAVEIPREFPHVQSCALHLPARRNSRSKATDQRKSSGLPKKAKCPKAQSAGSSDPFLSKPSWELARFPGSGATDTSGSCVSPVQAVQSYQATKAKDWWINPAKATNKQQTKAKGRSCSRLPKRKKPCSKRRSLVLKGSGFGDSM